MHTLNLLFQTQRLSDSIKLPQSKALNMSGRPEIAERHK